VAERLAKISEFGEYNPYRFNAAQANTLIDTAHTHGSFLGHVNVGTLGTTPVITLSNGPSSTPANIFMVITPTAPVSLRFECVCDRGLFVTVAGSGMDVCITANAMAI
jgi:hypothetical protein